jgi:hypothetical protein
VRDAHVEATPLGTLILDSSSFTIRDSGFFSNGTPENLSLYGCSDFVIDQVLVGQLFIDSTCSQYQVQNVVGANASVPASVQDSFLTMFQNPDEAITASGMARFTTENLIPNGDLSRWLPNGNLPPWPQGFSYMGVQPLVTQAGTGRFNPYGANVSGGGQSILVTSVPNSAQYAGQPVTIWADIQWVSGVAISLGVLSQYVSPPPPALQTETTILPATVPANETDWVRVAVTYYPSMTDQATGQTLSSWSILISPASDGDYEYCLGGVGALVGVAAPMGTFAPVPSFQQGLQVSGNLIQYGSGPPTSTTDTWLPGDLVYNQAPAPGGYVGWVCTAAGSPGTWNAFGAISS